MEESQIDRDDSGSAETTVGSFADFFSDWREPIRRSLALATGDVDLADQAVDEAMTRAYNSWEKIDGYDRPEGWVYRVGLNWSRGIFRKRRREVVDEIDADSASTDDRFPDIDLLEAVGDLSPRLRAVVVARYYLDWSTREVATALGIAEGTVRNRLSRALERLEKALEVEQ